MTRTSSELRRVFLEFFKSKGHTAVASGPLVPPNDPTLMFANAGMVQFKDVFTGREERAYRRATSSQKCIRISGKHNDLEAVGPSPRHHTFFEMLGNFSFGDYFKEEAIVFAWELLTQHYDLPKERLACTYFKGEKGIPEDSAARELWKKVTGFGDDRIRGLGMADNFWQMGDLGPCGPCSEIYFFHGDNPDPARFGDEQTPEGIGWMEIWNLVFMQFERKLDANGTPEFVNLPAPSIDTGMGLERLAGVVQGKTSNYDTDVLRALVDRAAELSGKPYRGTRDPDDVSMRVIADHARTTAFLIAEGILPERTGREYVLRRVMRRAIRHGHRLGIKKPFLHDVTLRLVDLMRDQYPELEARRELIANIAEGEEVRFRQTIERGLSLLDARFTELETQQVHTLPGGDAFQLYDTFGFPLDLTEVICAERGYAVDNAGYEAALEEARRRSDFKGMDSAIEDVYRAALDLVPNAAVRFSGYEKNVDVAPVVAIIAGGKLVSQVSAGEKVELVTSVTPFYGEAGGQIGDQGLILTANSRIKIEDTQKPLHGLVIHRGVVESGELTLGEEVTLQIDVPARERTRRNHSVTHLLHHALMKVVGGHAQQKGSLVGPDRLRFDFTHSKGLTAAELVGIEDIVNRLVLENHVITTEVLSMEQARARGAMMIFEEKYGDVVRLLSMGPSLELCGGTHARATGDIGLFKIIGEQGVAAGVRRITALTGEGVLQHLRGLERSLEQAAELAKANPQNLVERLEKILAHEKAQARQIEDLQRKLMSGGGNGIDAILGRAREVAGVKVLGVRSEVTDRAKVRELSEQLRDKLGDSIVLVGFVADGKAQLVLTVAKSLVGRFKAGELIRPIAEHVGGSGGGRPDMAQAGGTNPDGLDAAIEAVYQVVAAPSA